MSQHREPVTAIGAPAAIGPYSHAVRAGGLLFCSGQIPLDPDTGEPLRARDTDLMAGGLGVFERKLPSALAAQIILAAQSSSTAGAGSVTIGPSPAPSIPWHEAQLAREMPSPRADSAADSDGGGSSSAVTAGAQGSERVVSFTSEVTVSDGGETPATEGMVAHLYALVAMIDAQQLHTRDHSENDLQHNYLLIVEMRANNERHRGPGANVPNGPSWPWCPAPRGRPAHPAVPLPPTAGSWSSRTSNGRGARARSRAWSSPAGMSCCPGRTRRRSTAPRR